MSSATDSSIAWMRGPSLVVSPVTWTSFTATSDESRSQKW